MDDITIDLDNLNEQSEARILSIMIADMQGAMANHTDAMTYVLDSRDEYNAVGYAKGKKGKSNYVDKSIKKSVEAALPSITEPFLNKNIVLAQGRDAQSDQKAEGAGKLLNYQWNYGFKALPFIEQLSKDMMVDATVIIKSTWDAVKDTATTKIVDLDTIITDPTATSMDECVFVIERKKVSIGEIKRQPGLYGDLDDETLSALSPSTDTEYDRDEIGNDTSANFEDRIRQLVEVNFYYGSIPLDQSGELTPIIGVFSDSMFLNAIRSPYPDTWRGIPFDSEVYSRVTGSLYGESMPTLLSDNQKTKTQLQRSIFDTLDASTNGQRGFRQGTLSPDNMRKFKAGKDFEFSGEAPSIWEGSFNPISSDIYALMDRTQADSEELSGISRLNAGLDPRALNSNVSATASSLVNSAAERRLLLLTRHTSSLLESMFRKWLDMNMLMLSNGSVRIGGELIDVTALDLKGNYDITIDVATAGANQSLIQQLSFLIPQLGNNEAVPRSVVMGLTADMTAAMGLYETSDQLDVVAKQMLEAESQPQQPNPMQEAAVRLELEEKQANIAYDKSRTALNSVKTVETHIENEQAMYRQ